MSESSKHFVGYADGANRSTQNLSSAAWDIFSPNDELVSLQGIVLVDRQKISLSIVC